MSITNKCQATHVLDCSHCFGGSCKHYQMKCRILKEMTDKRLKIEVFGERNWQGHEDKRTVRYVDSNRVSKLKAGKL